MTNLALAIKMYMKLNTNSGEKIYFTAFELSNEPEFLSFEIEALTNAMDEIVASGEADVKDYVHPTYFLT